MSKSDAKFLRCENKSARGNAYPTLAAAKEAARQMRRKTRAWIRAYKCNVCTLFHIGRAARVDHWARANAAKAEQRRGRHASGSTVKLILGPVTLTTANPANAANAAIPVTNTGPSPFLTEATGHRYCEHCGKYNPTPDHVEICEVNHQHSNDQ